MQHQKTCNLAVTLALIIAFTAPAKLLANDEFTDVGRVLANPYAHDGAKIKIFGILGRYIAPRKALFSLGTMNMKPIVMLTKGNLAETEAIGGAIWCIATVQGTDTIETNNGDLEVLLVLEQSCQTKDYEWMRKEEILDEEEVVLSNRHQALSAKDPIRAAMVTLNPFALIGRKIFIAGTYRRNIDERSTVVDVWHPYPGNQRGLFMNYASVIMDTDQDLSTTWKTQYGVRAVRCIVEILGVKRTKPTGPFVPHVKEIECLTTVPASLNAPAEAPKQRPNTENQYLAIVEDTLDLQWAAHLTDATPKQAVVSFRIEKSGEISSVTLKQSSGEPQFDASALQAIQKINPLPPFPPDLKKDSLNVTYNFR